MKKIRFVISIIMILIIISCVFILSENINFSKDTTPITITIEEGTSVMGIYEILKENELVSSKLSYMLNLKLSNKHTSLRHGTFILNKTMNITEIFDELSSGGMTEDVFSLTIPEGYSVEKIAELLSQMNICTKDEFLDALNEDYDYEFLKDIPKKDYKHKLQGFLFPSTYEFFVSASPYDIINTLLKEFENQYSKIDNTSNMSMYDAVTLASLIEREAKLSSERYTISGVIKNRLDVNMKLQIDATVVYAISDGNYNVDKVLYKDLENPSLYNTYKYKGLPVGPICNPGLESIKAALSPEAHDYLYYHTDETKKDGSHIFTKNYDDHTNTQ